MAKLDGLCPICKTADIKETPGEIRPFACRNGHRFNAYLRSGITSKGNIVGVKLRMLRESRRLSQREFAQKTGLSQTGVYRFEKGSQLPSLQALEKIAATFGLTIDQVLGRETTNGKTNPKEAAAIEILVRTIEDLELNERQILALSSLVEGFFQKGEEPEEVSRDAS